MAIDDALLTQAAAGPAVWRLYHWQPACLSFGRNEPATRSYDRGRVHALGLDTVRRPTGGRAVWHADELTYSVAAPVSAFRSLRDAYCDIHSLLARALQRLGAPVTIADPAPTSPLGGGACFATAAGGEVLFRGRKMLGSAQVRRGSALLQHGSLLLAGDQQLVSAVSRCPTPPPHTATLSDALGRAATFEEVADAIQAELREWKDRWHELRWDAILSSADCLAERYRSAAWTWQR